MIHILVKFDYNADHTGAVHIHGVTENDDIAQAWESADTDCRRVTVDESASISIEPLVVQEQI